MPRIHRLHIHLHASPPLLRPYRPQRYHSHGQKTRVPIKLCHSLEQIFSSNIESRFPLMTLLKSWKNLAKTELTSFGIWVTHMICSTKKGQDSWLGLTTSQLYLLRICLTSATALPRPVAVRISPKQLPKTPKYPRIIRPNGLANIGTL